MKEDKRNRGFPNLDKYLKDRGRKLVYYEEGSEIYGMVNISEADKYIRKFQTTVHDDTDIEETKKLRGSKFVREIMKKH